MEVSSVIFVETMDAHSLGAVERMDSDLLGIFDDSADELLNSIGDIVSSDPAPLNTKDEHVSDSFWGNNSAHTSPRDAVQGARDTSPSSSEFSDSGAHATHTLSSVSPRDSNEMGSAMGTDEAERDRDEKKRRNRDAARACRAKKKRNIQNLQTGHEQLVSSYGELRKENEMLKSINTNLEKQLAFFQAMFKDTFQKSGAILPCFENDDTKSPTPQPKGAGAALGLAFLVATYNIQSDLVYSPTPAPVPYTGCARGRALLSIDDGESDSVSVWGVASLSLSVRWMLLVILVCFCLLRSTTRSRSGPAPAVTVHSNGKALTATQETTPKGSRGVLGRGLRCFRKGFSLVSVLPY